VTPSLSSGPVRLDRWLHAEAEVVDTTHLTPAEAASRIANELVNVYSCDP
jgi:hypothetical protein